VHLHAGGGDFTYHPANSYFDSHFTMFIECKQCKEKVQSERIFDKTTLAHALLYPRPNYDHVCKMIQPESNEDDLVSALRSIEITLKDIHAALSAR